jgi:recombination protein RecA
MKDTMMKLGLLSDEPESLGFVSTGSFALNHVVSGDYMKGLPIGGITQLIGDSSTAKTVFLTHVLSEAQKAGYITKIIDAENVYNSKFAKAMGVDPTKLYYSRIEIIEDIFEDVEKTVELIRKNDPDTPIILGIDSVAVAPIRKEITDNKGKDVGYEQSEITGALRAKVLGSCLRKINPLLYKNRVALIIINQFRSKVGVMFGNPDTAAAGGRALEFYLSVNLKTISNKTSDVIRDENKKTIGITGTVRCTKNKVSIPFQECRFELLFDKGLTPTYGLLEKLIEDGSITQEEGSTWFYYGKTKFRRSQFDDLLYAGEGELKGLNKYLNLEST